MPARSCNMSLADPCMVVSVEGVSVVGDGDEDGMVWATVRKKSSMYCNEAGSYWMSWISFRRGSGMGEREAYINRIGFPFVDRIHMPIRQQAIGE